MDWTWAAQIALLHRKGSSLSKTSLVISLTNKSSLNAQKASGHPDAILVVPIDREPKTSS
eukprot:scaffold218257_cov18-Tisochrysis_lutea.AAC.1